MEPNRTNLVREPTDVFERMFRAVEQVKERLDRACAALAAANVPYAIVGGNAVGAWVATVDEGAVRNTQDVDILLRREDLENATEALESVGFHKDIDMNVTMFLDGPNGKPSQAVHVIWANQKVKEHYESPTPQITQSTDINDKKVVDLIELVRMKLNSYRRKDQVHLLDMISVGLIDQDWPQNFGPVLSERLQSLLDDPEG